MNVCITFVFYRMIVSCLGGLVFHSVGYYLILLWMSISIGFFMVQYSLFPLIFISIRYFSIIIGCSTLQLVRCQSITQEK